jgi:hypothetical protein
MLITKPLFFSILCILCLSSLASFSTVKSQISLSNVSPFKGTTYTLTGNIYNVTFVESGLPSGTQWEAIFNGAQHFSLTNTIKIDNVSAATYLWSIPNAVALNLYEGNGTVYSASPPSGGMSIAPYFLNIAQQITFYPVSTSSPSPSPTPTATTPTSTPIVPEFSAFTILAVFLVLSLFTVAVVTISKANFHARRQIENKKHKM